MFIKILCLILIFAVFINPIAFASDVGNYKLSARGAIAIDFETGNELYNHNADILRPPASMTKMMTVYLVYEAISQGLFDFDTLVPISSRVADFSINPNETNVPLSRSGIYTVDEMLDVTIAISAGGAARALAELVGGTQQDFIDMMNAKVAEWEIDAVFHSASGGSSSRVSPRAMAIITRNTILEFPEVLEKTSKPTIEYKGRSYTSTNLLFGSYDGIDGYKTGTNNVAGACFSGTAIRDETRIIVVVMGSSMNNRFKDTAALLDYGFAAMEEVNKEKTILLETQAIAEAAEAERVAAEAAETARLIAEQEAAEVAKLIAEQEAVKQAALDAELAKIAAEQEAIRLIEMTAAAEQAARVHEATSSNRHFLELISMLSIVAIALYNNYKRKNQQKKNV